MELGVEVEVMTVSPSYTGTIRTALADKYDWRSDSNYGFLTDTTMPLAQECQMRFSKSLGR